MKQRRASLRKHHYIYRTERFDGKYYIGMHSTDDLEDGYLGSGSHLLNSVKKYGREKHRCYILEFLPSREEARIKERELVTAETVSDPMCMNMQLGGFGGSPYGVKLSETARLNMSLAKKGKPLSEAHRKAQGDGRRGKPRSEECKKKLSARMRNIPNASAVKLKKPCTIDGITIYPSVKDFTQALGYGKNGLKHPYFRFVQE